MTSVNLCLPLGYCSPYLQQGSNSVYYFRCEYSDLTEPSRRVEPCLRMKCASASRLYGLQEIGETSKQNRHSINSHPLNPQVTQRKLGGKTVRLATAQNTRHLPAMMMFPSRETRPTLGSTA